MKNFTLQELTRSQTAQRLGLDNTPPIEHIRNIEEAVRELLDPLREAWAVRCASEQWGTPALRITSGYRGADLNKAVGGSSTSAHCVGYAFDIVPANGKMVEFKCHCRDFLEHRAFDQLISEDENAERVPRWIHMGFRNTSGGQRRQMLSMRGGRYSRMA